MASSPHIYSQTIQMFTDTEQEKRKNSWCVPEDESILLQSQSQQPRNYKLLYKLHLFLQKTVHK